VNCEKAGIVAIRL